jgi:hypothetical protein
LRQGQYPLKARCRSRRCPSCGILWAGDARRKLLANVEHYGGDVALVTATAPGSDRLPDRRAMVEWNLDAPGRWRRLHTAARSAAVRRGFRVTIVARTWEYQKRGALHVHVVVGTATAAEMAGAHEYAHQLARLRATHDFGFIDRGRRTGTRRALEIVPAARAARYLAKYLSPLDRDGKPTLSETVLRRDVPPHVLHVQRELTQATGITMRSLRRLRRCHAMGVNPETGELLDDPASRIVLPRDFLERLVKAHTDL